MPLSQPVSAAVLEVVRRLRDPVRPEVPISIGVMLLDAMEPLEAVQQHAVFESVRLALGLSLVPGSLARWARGKSREEVAQALEKVATSENAP